MRARRLPPCASCSLSDSTAIPKDPNYINHLIDRLTSRTSFVNQLIDWARSEVGLIRAVSRAARAPPGCQPANLPATSTRESSPGLPIELAGRLNVICAGEAGTGCAGHESPIWIA